MVPHAAKKRRVLEKGAGSEGETVEFQNFLARADLNGKRGVIKHWDEKDERFVVEIEGEPAWLRVTEDKILLPEVEEVMPEPPPKSGPRHGSKGEGKGGSKGDKGE